MRRLVVLGAAVVSIATAALLACSTDDSAGTGTGSGGATVSDSAVGGSSAVEGGGAGGVGSGGSAGGGGSAATAATGGSSGSGGEKNAANALAAVGINLSANQWDEVQIPFANALRKARPWRETPSGGCGQSPEDYTGATDAAGYPIEMGSRSCVFTELLPPSYAIAHWPLGTWVLRFDGDATFDVRGSASGLVVTADRATFTMGTMSGGLKLDIDALNTEDPPRNLRLYPPGGVCAKSTSEPHQILPWAYCSTARCEGGTCEGAGACPTSHPECVDMEDAGESGEALFHPLWLSTLTRYRTLRFMNWLHTNHSTVTSFSTFRTENDWTWEYRNYPGNVPLGVIAELCNVLNTDCYVNLPHQLSNADITQFVAFFRDALKPSLELLLEYSNEVWNSGLAEAWTFAWQQANALPVSEFAGSDCVPGASFGVKQDCADQYYGKRVYESCNIAQQVFDDAGQGDRLECLMARQASDVSKLQKSLDCPRWLGAPQGNCYAGGSIDGIALNLYVGNVSACTAPNSEQALCNDMVSGSQGVNARFCTSDDCWIEEHATALDARQLTWDIYAYEGGQHYDDSSYAPCVALQSHACMHDAYVSLLDAWKAQFAVNGRRVRTFIHFDHLSAYAPTSAGGNLFGVRGRMDGDSSSWPKEAGLLDWSSANPCWWSGCALP